MSRRFRILSLDGGGIRGAYSAAFLAEIEAMAGKRIYEHFDLITGTSTGGLLALALALGHPASRAVEFYRVDGPLVFPPGFMSRWWRCLKSTLFTKHRACVLADKLQRFYGRDTKLGEARTRVVIPAFDVAAGAPVCFKTRHHERLVADYQRPAWEIGMATSAAPTYFPPYKSSWGARFVDGGVWANRPSLVGVLEAVLLLGVCPEQIDLLVVGTTHSRYRLHRDHWGGLVPWALHGVHELLMDASTTSAWFETQLLLRPDNIIEVDADAGRHPIRLDDTRDIDTLVGLGVEAAKRSGNAVIKQFFSTPTQPFQPLPASR